jgi:hypothetical protein
MCFPAIGAAIAPILTPIFGGAAAGGAAAAGTGITVGSILSTAGALIGAGGALYQGRMESAAADANAKYVEQQRRSEAMLAAVQDERTRERMRGAIAQQRSQLAARGVSLDSPTAVLLGRKAAEEMSFASQSVRSGAAATDAELSAEARMYRGRARTSMLTGQFSAAAGLLSKAPDLWPGLAERRVLT